MLRVSRSYFGLAVVALIMVPVASIAGWSCGGSETHGSTVLGQVAANGGSGSLHSTGPHEGSGAGSFAGSMSTSSMMTSSGPGGDPQTCAQAAQFHTYIGCDSLADGDRQQRVVDLRLRRRRRQHREHPRRPSRVQRGGTDGRHGDGGSRTRLTPIYLPWVTQLKGADFVRRRSGGGRLLQSVGAGHGGGAYPPHHRPFRSPSISSARSNTRVTRARAAHPSKELVDDRASGRFAESVRRRMLSPSATTASLLLPSLDGDDRPTTASSRTKAGTASTPARPV